jgi:hypothetical protein
VDSPALERAYVLLANAIDQKDEPIDRLALGCRKVRALCQRRHYLAKLWPTPVEINQVAWRFSAPPTRPAFVTSKPVWTFRVRVHFTHTLTRARRPCRVKKT